MSNRNISSQYSYILLFGLFETAAFGLGYPPYEMDLDNAVNIDQLHSYRLNELKYQRVLHNIVSRAIGLSE